MTEPSNDLTAVDRVNRADWRRRLIVIGLILILPVIALSFVLQIMRINRPIDQPTDEMYFRYGSIGSDVEGVPYWVFRVMPEICQSLTIARATLFSGLKEWPFPNGSWYE